MESKIKQFFFKYYVILSNHKLVCINLNSLLSFSDNICIIIVITFNKDLVVFDILDSEQGLILQVLGIPARMIADK